MKKQAIYRDYTIMLHDNGSVYVEQDGKQCDSVKSVIREISDEVGFVPDIEWTGRQQIVKLIKFINEQKL